MVEFITMWMSVGKQPCIMYPLIGGFMYKGKNLCSDVPLMQTVVFRLACIASSYALSSENKVAIFSASQLLPIWMNCNIGCLGM